MGESNRKPLREMSREELEQLATERELPPHSTKSREELIHALESWKGRPADEHSSLHDKNEEELRQIAKDRGIETVSDMEKEQLISAIHSAGYGSQQKQANIDPGEEPRR